MAKGAGVLGIRAFIGHHDAQAVNLRIHHGPEGVERTTVLLDPPVIDIVRAHRMFDRKQWRDLVMLQNHLALGVENEADVEEAVFDIRVTCFGLCYDKGIVGASDGAECFGLFARNVDGAFSGKLHVIEIQDLVIKTLQRAFGEGDEAYGQIQAGQPGGGFDQM